MAQNTAHFAATFALEIEGKHVCFLNSFDGGGAFAEVIESPVSGGPTDKSIGSVQYDDIVVTCPLPEGPLAAWVTDFLAGKAPEHDGAVISLNLNRQTVRRLEWTKGAIFSVSFPAPDVNGGKKPVELTIAIRPATTREIGGSGVPFAGKTTKGKTSSTVGNFAVTMKGVDCTRVMRIEPIVVTQTYLESGRRARKPGPMQVSDVVVTVPQSFAGDFVRWSEDFIVAGNNTQAHEKDITIRFLTANLRDDLATLSVLSTGIYRVDDQLQESGLATIARTKVSLYAEQVQWVIAPEPAVPPAEPTAKPSADHDLRGVLGRRLTAAEVVRRLREEPASEQRPDGVDTQRRLGREVGLAWAQRHASLTELRAVAAADEQDWSSLNLPEGHSLAETLAATVDIPLLYDGRLELPRDALSEGVVSGVLEALAELNEQIEV